MAQLRYLPRDGTQPELWQPDSGWRPYEGPLPRLQGVAVAIDTEERDDGLAAGVGPGWVYDQGYICGVSAAWGESSIYVPIRHPETDCRPIGEVISWVESIFRDCEVFFFQSSYDLAWLWHEGCRVWPERMHDGYLMSVMLDENQFSYSLDDCCAREGIQGKDQLLLEMAARSLGVDAKKGMWRMPGRFVGPYAEQDACSTMELCRRLLPRIREEGQEGAYQTEIALVRVLYEMRRRGIRINEAATYQAADKIRERRDETLRRAASMTGGRVTMRDMRSPEALQRMFSTQDIILPRTKATKHHPVGMPSVTKGWLEQSPSPFARTVREARVLDDLAEKFITTYIAGHLHRGRIHAEIHQLRDDDGGARTQRLSYSNPPLQQMPARADPSDKERVEMVKAIRTCFLPEDGEIWASPDYASQEPRFMVHFAYLCRITGAEVLYQAYHDNPRTNPHDMTVKLTGLHRQAAKDVTQGISYGAGIDKIAAWLGVDEEEARRIIDVFNTNMPHILGLSDFASRMAKERGYVRLIDGARRHFNDWGPRGARVAERGIDAARARWPGRPLERAFTYRAGNSLSQGSAARQMKRAMVACHSEGVLPLIQMHDELGASITTRREAEIMERCMVDSVRLCIPVCVDVECGPDWGHAKMKLEEMGL